ncbi:hypothetical protein ACHAXR_002365, partial [Thalassiosira sp. AJA248-18]
MLKISIALTAALFGYPAAKAATAAHPNAPRHDATPPLADAKAEKSLKGAAGGRHRLRGGGGGDGRQSVLEGDDVASAPAASNRRLVGCRDETYVNGGSYNIGDWVSAQTTDTETTYVSDPKDGFTTQSITATETYNYECISAVWCGNEGYKPGSTGESAAWKKEGVECSVRVLLFYMRVFIFHRDYFLRAMYALTVHIHLMYFVSSIPQGNAPAVPASTVAAWSEKGCPQNYRGGHDYFSGEFASLEGLVYQCTDEPFKNLFCGMNGYEPSSGQYWEDVWKMLGSCFGTLAPTKSPVYESLTDVGGCPAEYKSGGEVYEEGDRVGAHRLVYECKSGPVSAHCSQAGYEPNSNPAMPDAWKVAWDLVGYCAGTIAPTSSPNFVQLNNLGGCPNAYSKKT